MIRIKLDIPNIYPIYLPRTSGNIYAYFVDLYVIMYFSRFSVFIFIFSKEGIRSPFSFKRYKLYEGKKSLCGGHVELKR